MLSSRNNLVLLTYFVVVIGFLTFIPISGHVGPFSFPTSVSATNIVRHGRITLSSSLPAKAYWINMLSVERDYPAPSLLLAMLQIISNIPFDILPFLPISGFTIFIFYYAIIVEVLYRKDLFRNSLNHLTILLLIIYDLFNRIHAYYVGRASLGAALFIVSVFLILKLFGSNKKKTWIILIMIILVTTSFTYYTSILATASIFLLFLITYATRFLSFDQHTKNAILGLVTLSLFLLSYQPIMSGLLISPSKFVNNLVAWILTQLKIEKNTEAFYLNVGNVPIDPFTRVSVVWLGFLFRILSILAFVMYLLNRLRNMEKLRINEPLDTLIIITIGASLAELSYTFQAPTLSLRFVTMLSVLYFPLMITRIKKIEIKTIANIIISVLLVIFYVGSINSTILYGNINAPQSLYGFNSFISGITQPHYSTIIAGDSYYTSYASFKVFLSTGEGRLHFTILGSYVIYLFSSHENSTINAEEFVNHDINYLLLINDGKPISGDPWGYIIMPSHSSINFLLHRLEIIYNDEHVYLLSMGNFK